MQDMCHASVQVDSGAKTMLRPGDIIAFGSADGGGGTRYKIKMYHRSERERLERSYSATPAKGAAKKEPVSA